jgi:hypothetical protein
MTMTLNFNKICRLCMVEDTQLSPLFLQDDSLIDRLMTLVPILKVSICRHCLTVCMSGGPMPQLNPNVKNY